MQYQRTAVDENIKIIELVNADSIRDAVNNIATLITKERNTLEFVRSNYPDILSMPETRSRDDNGYRVIIFSKKEHLILYLFPLPKQRKNLVMLKDFF